MNLKNYINYGMCIYTNGAYQASGYKLGDIVINGENEVGVIIQIHADGDFRTDMFGNVSPSEVKMATDEQVAMYRPSILNEANFAHS